jgi:hypothetical protein
MKTITKLLFAGSAFAAAGAAAAGPISVLPNTPGGSDIILFVTDTSNNAQFVQDLGVNVDSLGITQASVATDVGGGTVYSLFGTGTVGPGLNNPTVSSSIINSSGIDTALATFLSNNAGGNFIYGIQGAATGDGTVNAGQARTVASITGSPSQVNADVISGTPTTLASTLFLNDLSSSDAGTAAQTVNSFYPTVNAGTNTPFGGSSGNGKQAAAATGVNGYATLGTQTYLYELVSTGGSEASIYGSTVGITVGAGGAISGIGSGAPVPLPAAVWLLGSGVLGLFGIGRRRLAAHS